MQFDEAVFPYGTKSTQVDMMTNLDRLFDTTPYERPSIVCWNLRPVRNTAATSHTPGIALVSGFSKDTFKNIINGTISTPYDIMRNTIDNSRYDILEV